jgi:T5SS/PEP-CTERM-associated repeat protein
MQRNRSLPRRLPRASALAGVALLVLDATATPTGAQGTNETAWAGAVSTDWFDPANCTNGVPKAGDITTIDTVVPNPTVLKGAAGQISSIVIGEAGEGNLTIQNVLNTSLSTLGNQVGSVGTVTVTGPGKWASGDITVGFSTGTLVIQDGGVVTNTRADMGVRSDGVGTVIVSGPGSTWSNTGQLIVAEDGIGTMLVQERAVVTSADGFIAFGAGQGTVLVTGPGSAWNNRRFVRVGVFAGGTGTLTIADGATVTAPAFVSVGFREGSVGFLNIGAAPGDAPAAPGFLITPTVFLGPEQANVPPGQGTLTFNHTATDYVFAPVITGPGNVNVLAGTTIFTAANTYSGRTLVGAIGTFSPNSAHTVMGRSRRRAGAEIDEARIGEAVHRLAEPGEVESAGARPGACRRRSPPPTMSARAAPWR